MENIKPFNDTMTESITVKSFKSVLGSENYDIYLNLVTPSYESDFFVNSVRDKISKGYCTGSSKHVKPFDFNRDERSLDKINEILYKTKDGKRVRYMVYVKDNVNGTARKYLPVGYNIVMDNNVISYDCVLKLLKTS